MDKDNVGRADVVPMGVRIRTVVPVLNSHVFRSLDDSCRKAAFQPEVGFSRKPNMGASRYDLERPMESR